MRDHKADGVTLHGQDEDDRKALLTVSAKRMVAAAKKDRTWYTNGVEHMVLASALVNVVNCGAPATLLRAFRKLPQDLRGPRKI